MTVLFRWMFVSSLARVVAIAFGVILLFMVAESFAKMNLIGKTMTLAQLAEYLVLKVPFSLTDFMPVIVLLGTALYMVEISHHHELIAIRAAGISMRHILSPLLAAAATVGLITFALGEWVEPVTNVRLDEMERTLVQGKPAQSHGAQWLKDDKRFFRLQPLQGDYFSLMMLEVDERGQWQGRLDASKAVYRQHQWYLERVYINRPDAQGIHTRYVPKMTLATDVSPATAEPPKPRDMQWFELYAFTQALADAGLDARSYEYSLHRKLAGPLACLIMVLLAYSLCGDMGSRIAANSKGFLLALILGLGFYIFSTSVAVFVEGGNLPPAYAAWWPDILFLGISGYLLLRKEGY